MLQTYLVEQDLQIAFAWDEIGTSHPIVDPYGIVSDSITYRKVRRILLLTYSSYLATPLVNAKIKQE